MPTNFLALLTSGTTNLVNVKTEHGVPGNETCDDTLDSVEGKKKQALLRRKMKNRERVRKCRERKDNRFTYLIQRNASLEAENDLLMSKCQKFDHLVPSGLAVNAKSHIINAQLATVTALKEALNGGIEAIRVAALRVWHQNAHIIHACSGHRSGGFDAILDHYEMASKVYESYNVKRVRLDYPTDSVCHAVAHWDLDVVLRHILPTHTTRLPPFSTMAEHVAGETITMTMTSYLTFKDDKISEDVRVVNSLDLLSSILSNNPTRSATSVSAITHAISTCKK